MAYWDTSCIVKLYAPEPNSAAFRSRLLGGDVVLTSEIARLELWTTLRRKEAEGHLRTTGARQALLAFDQDIRTGMITVVKFDAAVSLRFESIVEHCLGMTPFLPLRTLDAIHLATAVVVGANEIVATDRYLREAAKALGISVYP
ncbi:MAG TPA: type II toxin-antitoxin system VapC family toxin [Tepidisphaeraceae bacterium]|jgi:predicted nucleic acid-binding protein|nr:type II toxin-antitoxin system VapC family toxin [Tepidisphaeraceae bacterium]